MRIKVYLPEVDELGYRSLFRSWRSEWKRRAHRLDRARHQIEVGQKLLCLICAFRPGIPSTVAYQEKYTTGSENIARPNNILDIHEATTASSISKAL